MVRAAGMPLADGELPPGSLTVRVVQGAFAGDLTGLPVEVELNGSETRQAFTGAKGRAEFAHLPIGAGVRVTASVGGERLQSDVFPMPAESGLRVLLVTGTGDPSEPETISAGSALATLPPPVADSVTTTGAVRITVVALTLLAIAFFGRQWRSRRHIR